MASSPTISISILGASSNAITVYCYNLLTESGSGTKYIAAYVYLNGTAVAYNTVSLAETASTGTVTIGGLSPNTYYTVLCTIDYLGYGTSATSNTTGGYTQPIQFTPTGSISVIGSTSSTISVQVSNLSLVSGCRPVQIDFYAQINGVMQAYGGSLTLSDYSSIATNVVTFQGLAASTSYDIVCPITYYGMQGVATSYTTNAVFYGVSTAAARPPLFYWTYPKIAGYSQQANMPASEWNDFRANVIAVLAYKGYSVSPTIAYSGAQVSRSHYNSIVTALQSAGYGLTLSTVAAGQQVSESALNALLNVVNSIS